MATMRVSVSVRRQVWHPCFLRDSLAMIMLLLMMMMILLLQQHPNMHLSLGCHGLSLSSSSVFHGTPLFPRFVTTTITKNAFASPSSSSSSSSSSQLLTMRKQKASDRRTRRMQRGYVDENSQLANERIRDNLSNTLMTQSPMAVVGGWNHKRRTSTITEGTTATERISTTTATTTATTTTTISGGRRRSRKRSMLYNSLSSYHNKFMQLLTMEYRAEVSIPKRKV
jgi:hypothetical protein